MFDNGLLKYYMEHKTTNGYFNADEVSSMSHIDTSMLNTRKIDINNNPFYMKFHNRKGTLHKSQADAEILLSQIYTKAGITSSIYYPTQKDGVEFLLCDDVEKPNVTLASNHTSRIFHLTGKTPQFLSRVNTGFNPGLFYSENALIQQTKLRILDTASYNTDRHPCNFFYTMQRDVKKGNDLENLSFGGQIVNYFRMLKSNRAEDVIAIDFESSGINVSDINRGIQPKGIFNSYINDFKRSVMSREDMLEEFKFNEPLAELIDKKAFAEEIGSLNPKEVAQDIKETTGYEIDKDYVDTLSKSYDEIAETLVQ